MKAYKVPVVYQMHGYVTVVADSKEDAIAAVENGGGDMPLPVDSDYLEGSFEVDHEGVVVEEVENPV